MPWNYGEALEQTAGVFGQGGSVTRKWPENAAASQVYLRAPYSGNKAMSKLKEDPNREDRIHNEAVVDTYGPEERSERVGIVPLVERLRHRFEPPILDPDLHVTITLDVCESSVRESSPP
jgi:hypothetical protein